MRKLILLLLVVAMPALAADTNVYPFTLIDQTCTDSNDDPTAVTPGLTYFAGRNPPAPAAQTDGDPDGYCDNRLAHSEKLGWYRTSNSDLSLWAMPRVCISLSMRTMLPATRFAGICIPTSPHDSGLVRISQQPNHTGTGDVVTVIGPDLGDPGGPADGIVIGEDHFTGAFNLRLDLVGATAMTAEISILPF